MQHFGNRECGREPVRVVLPFVMRNGIINAPDASACAKGYIVISSATVKINKKTS